MGGGCEGARPGGAAAAVGWGEVACEQEGVGAKGVWSCKQWVTCNSRRQGNCTKQKTHRGEGCQGEGPKVGKPSPKGQASPNNVANSSRCLLANRGCRPGFASVGLFKESGCGYFRLRFATLFGAARGP